VLACVSGVTRPSALAEGVRGDGGGQRGRSRCLESLGWRLRQSSSQESSLGGGGARSRMRQRDEAPPRPLERSGKALSCSGTHPLALSSAPRRREPCRHPGPVRRHAGGPEATLWPTRRPAPTLQSEPARRPRSVDPPRVDITTFKVVAGLDPQLLQAARGGLRPQRTPHIWRRRL
jgi:hypothetical protein